MSDKHGLYEKFLVRRADGRDVQGEKHHNCRYFVLDIDHDPHAAPALHAYASSVKEENPELSRDLLSLAGFAGYKSPAPDVRRTGVRVFDPVDPEQVCDAIIDLGARITALEHQHHYNSPPPCSDAVDLAGKLYDILKYFLPGIEIIAADGRLRLEWTGDGVSLEAEITADDATDPHVEAARVADVDEQIDRLETTR